jgi:hypothetical protein
VVEQFYCASGHDRQPIDVAVVATQGGEYLFEFGKSLTVGKFCDRLHIC